MEGQGGEAALFEGGDVFGGDADGLQRDEFMQGGFAEAGGAHGFCVFGGDADGFESDEGVEVIVQVERIAGVAHAVEIRCAVPLELEAVPCAESFALDCQKAISLAEFVT